MADQQENKTVNPVQNDVSMTDVVQPRTPSQQDDTSDSPLPERTLGDYRRDPNLKVCRYNIYGTCRFGDSCRYSHVYQSKETNTDGCFESRHTICPRHQTLLQETPSTSIDPVKWVEAEAFVPQHWKNMKRVFQAACEGYSVIMCPHSVMEIGPCLFPANVCPYLHGDVCDICGVACLDPADEAQRKAHKDQCTKNMEKDMNETFARKCSHDRICGICREVVWDKEPSTEKKFGLLENCSHVFCLSCIRTWRQSRRPSDNLEPVHPPLPTRNCPECRVHSNFFVPSHYWVENDEEKQKTIQHFKETVSKKPCKYFKVGSTCALAENCFYLHSESIRIQMQSTPNSVPPPRRRLESEDGDILEAISVWAIEDSLNQDAQDL